MRRIALLLLLVSCKPQKLIGVEQCGFPCWTGPDGMAGIGECRKGTWSCDDDGGIQCLDSVGPTTEVCDNLDNDCNGQVDDNIGRVVCNNGCEDGYQACEQGHPNCVANRPKPEVCNGFDDDCNGLVDDNLPVEFCYDGPDNTVGKGVCHPGVKSCIDGLVKCRNEQRPLAELCNNVDDDCDGVVDNSNAIDGGCATARDLKVVLVWDRPSDIDLHLRSPLTNSWSLTPWDCYYANKNPTWYPTNSMEDPHLDRDDISGMGPETTTIEMMSMNDVYTIGVVVYAGRPFLFDGGLDPIEAQVTVSCGGVQVTRVVFNLTNQKETWVVGNVRYSATALSGCQFNYDGTSF